MGRGMEFHSLGSEVVFHFRSLTFGKNHSRCGMSGIVLTGWTLESIFPTLDNGCLIRYLSRPPPPSAAPFPFPLSLTTTSSVGCMSCCLFVLFEDVRRHEVLVCAKMASVSNLQSVVTPTFKVLLCVTSQTLTVKRKPPVLANSSWFSEFSPSLDEFWA